MMKIYMDIILSKYNYKFIGGDKDFYYRYNKHIKDNFENFKTIDFIGKKKIIIKIN